MNVKNIGFWKKTEGIWPGQKKAKTAGEGFSKTCTHSQKVTGAVARHIALKMDVWVWTGAQAYLHWGLHSIPLKDAIRVYATLSHPS